MKKLLQMDINIVGDELRWVNHLWMEFNGEVL
jgi:hypothetical protein